MHGWKILIADDEKEARELILHYLHKRNDNLEINQCADGISTLQSLTDFQPDILFLDIKMPDLNGLEVLQKKQPAQLPAVIFTTAFDDYALPAFDFEAIDYLLKPFEQDRFDKAIKRAMDYVEIINQKKKEYYLQNLPVKTGSKTELVPVNDIQFLQAEGAYVQIVTENKSYLITESMYELELALDPKQFSRVHRSVIVKISCIKSIHSLLNGDHQLILINGKEVRASRTYRDKIKNLMGKN